MRITTAKRFCRKCGAAIPPDSPQHSCGACLLEAALGADEAVAGVDDPDRPIPLLMDFGDYELLEQIGRGGQGVVFRARQKSLNRTVALKVINLGQWASKTHLKRFRLEAEAAARLEHPGIVPIHEVGERDGQCYFSMKFVEGGQLGEVARHEPMPIRRAVELIAKVARTVHYAHEHGILHRDIKPGNILLDANGEPHLTDFGLARLVESESTVTRTMEVLGTPSYMAPEQAVGNNAAVNSATDVYGLGAVLYQLLTGQPPFAGGTTYETIKLVLDNEPRQPRQLNPKVDRDLSTICLKCLEKDPKRRYSSALALAEDLERWLKHEPISARHTGIAGRSKKWVWRNPTSALLAASLLALAAVVGWNIWKSELVHRPLTTGIAVLPFKPLLPENRDPVLEMGMADTLITTLSNSGGMNVISLTSVRQYGDPGQDPLVAGRKLGVNSVLEGNVQKSGDRLRVTVRLIKVEDGSSLWAGTFDEKFTDVFTVQDTIAKKVANALALRLSGEEEKRLTKRYTENVEAYQFYLTGRYHLAKLTPPDVTKSIGFFQQAIEADPGYALAYFGLAEAYRTLSLIGDRRPKELFPLAKAAATKAVQIDESLAESHASLAFIHMWFDWDWVGAEREARRAIALNPNSAFAHYAWAHVLSNLGRHQEAIAEAARARELDPVSLLFNAREGAVFYYAGRNNEARERLQKTVELDPNFWIAHLYLGHVYLEKKNYPEAIAEFTKARDFSRGNSQTISMIGYVSALAGDTAKARAILGELKSRSAHEYVPRYNIAVVHLALVEQDEVFAWLEKAYEEHDVLMSFLKIDPKWDSVRSDPRFVAILERVGLH